MLVPVLKFELEGLEALRGIGSEEKHDADALSPTPRATSRDHDAGVLLPVLTLWGCKL